jgi:hypothetical protein
MKASTILSVPSRLTVAMASPVVDPPSLVKKQTLNPACTAAVLAYAEAGCSPSIPPLTQCATLLAVSQPPHRHCNNSD